MAGISRPLCDKEPSGSSGPRASGSLMIMSGRDARGPEDHEEALTIQVHPLTPHIGARLTGIDARKPLSPAEVAAIEAAMDQHAVTILPGQDINDEQQLAFSRNFGPLEEGANSGARDSELRLPVVFADVSNLDKDRRIAERNNKKRMAALGNRLWHTDASFRVVPA